jgi:sarcosine oxidase
VNPSPESRTHGLWERTAPPAPHTQRLESDVDVDVAVVGAGFTGLSAALHLAQAGVRVAVLEAETVGHGGSGRNVGLLNAGLWLPPRDVIATLGQAYGERLLVLLGDAPGVVRDLITRHAIDCELTTTGTLHCGVGETGRRDLEMRTAQWLERGAPVQLLNADETEKAVGSSAYGAALLDRRAGTLQPLAYVRGLATAALKAGAAIYDGARIARIEADGNRWMLESTGRRVRADWVIVATNAYTTTPWPEVRAEITRLPYFQVATDPLPRDVLATILPERQGVWDTKKVLSSFRLDRDGRLIFGSVGALRGTGTAVHRTWAQRAIARLFPHLRNTPLTSGWYGMIGMSEDSIPRFHRLAPRVVGFSAYNGRGIAPGTVFGKTLSDLVLGRITEPDLPLPVTDPVGAPMRRVHEAGYELGAQLLHAAGAIWPLG